jgi:type IV pilus assembly protein PilQ
VNKVPVLGDIPYLGALFRATIDENKKAELLIFVTPRIVMQTKY